MLCTEVETMIVFTALIKKNPLDIQWALSNSIGLGLLFSLEAS